MPRRSLQGANGTQQGGAGVPAKAESHISMASIRNPHLRYRIVCGAALCAAVALLIVILDEGPPATAARLPPGRPVTIAWGGDTTLGSSHGLPPQHGWTQLKGIASLLRAADVTAVNSEGTFTNRGSSKCGGADSGQCFAFRAPPGNAASLSRAGIDIVNLANNHAFDFGASGMGQTVTSLRKHHVEVTGRPGEIAIKRVPGARIAFVGFSTYRWSSPMDDPARVRSIIRSAARRANIVVAFFHAGAEGADRVHTPGGAEEAFGEHRGNVRSFAHLAVESGADLVVGSGPHVMRGLELYRHRLVAYSMGNLAGWHNFATGGNLSLSGLLRVTLDDSGRMLTGRFEGLRLDGNGVPHRDTTGQARSLISGVSREDFPGRGVTVAGDGRLVLPGD